MFHLVDLVPKIEKQRFQVLGEQMEQQQHVCVVYIYIYIYIYIYAHTCTCSDIKSLESEYCGTFNAQFYL